MIQLRLLVIASLLAPALVFGALGWMTWLREQTEARRSITQTLDLVQEHTLKTFETVSLVAEGVDQLVSAMSDADIRRSEADLHLRLRRIADTLAQVEDIWIFDAEGVPLVSASLYPAPKSLSAADRDYFQVQQGADAKVYVSRILSARAGDQRFFQFSVKRSDATGAFRGVTAVSVEPDYLRDFQRRVVVGSGLSVALVREDGDVLARFPTETRDLVDRPQTLPGFVELRKSAPEQGLVKTSSMFQGGQRLLGYRRLPSFPVYITAAIGTDAIARSWLDAMGGYLLIGVPSTLGLFLLSVLALRTFKRENAALAALQSEAERREAAEAALRQVQKIEAVGRLTGGIAHDFNNLLTVVLGNLDMLLHRLDPADARARRAATLAKEGAIRAALLTQRLLAFSRQQPLSPQRVDANALVAGMSDLTRRTLGEKIKVRCVLPRDPLPVNIDANQLESAILNLAVNARDAMTDGGTLTIETAGERVAQPSRDPESPPPGDYVVIRVRDTGSGIPSDVLPKVFEPFFTTKPHGQGTGLGLSQVYGFIKQSGGYVIVESAEGRGTTVSLYLPPAGEAQETAQTDQPPAGASASETPGRDRVALVVEDDPNVRRFSVEALRQLGFEVIEAADAVGAMTALASRPDVDLLFSDVGLPGSDGRALARSALARNPRLHVLLTSGHANQIGRASQDDSFELLPKPFSVEQLAERIGAAFAA
ncbi:ATP-binding protein [Alsobacter sp. SYSU M60028]|uniref:histidine kinase n=1 Tax=Alsobacter ponti TaxID=2962936 RepID=A0ABT1L862_9HYPH|nr:ATP-binding protein [Alsobacter ponti]MCP8937256.1 ATP-binding protein [Alsobacter ponti]